MQLLRRSRWTYSIVARPMIAAAVDRLPPHVRTAAWWVLGISVLGVASGYFALGTYLLILAAPPATFVIGKTFRIDRGFLRWTSREFLVAYLLTMVGSLVGIAVGFASLFSIIDAGLAVRKAVGSPADAFLLTIVVETAVVAIFMRRWSVLWESPLVNLATWPWATVFFVATGAFWRIEIAVFVAETLLWIWLARLSTGKAALVSLLSNAASAGLGMVVR